MAHPARPLVLVTAALLLIVPALPALGTGPAPGLGSSSGAIHDEVAWEQAASPAGAATQSIGGNEQVLLAATWNHGVFRSTDHGRTWAPAPGTDIGTGRIAADPHDPDVLYVAGFRGVDRTTDGGETWEKVIEDGQAQRIAVSPTGKVAVTVQASGYSTIHLSTDQGETWETRDSPLPRFISSYGISFGATDQDLLTASIGDVWVSHDDGQTWTDTGEETRAIVRDDTGTVWRAGFSGTGLMRSEDSGDTWIDVELPGTGAPKAIGPVPGGGVVGATNDGVIRTTDDGATWENLGGDDVAFAATSIITDPRDPEAVFMSDENVGVTHIARNALGAWDLQGRTTGFPLVHLSAMGSSWDGSLLLAGGLLGLYASEDGGESWSHTGAAIGMNGVRAAQASQDGNSIYIGGQNRILSGYVQVSHDRGATWHTALPDQNDGVIRGIAVDPTDPDHAWAAAWIQLTDSKVYETTDGGQTWQATLTLPTKVFDVVWAPHLGTAVAATETGVFVQEPLTGLWTPRTLSLDPLQTITAGDQAVYAPGLDTPLWRTYGETDLFLPWAETTTPIRELTAEPGPEQVLWAVHTSGTLDRCTPQDGATGTCQAANLPTGLAADVLAPTASELVYTASRSDGIWTTAR